MKRVAFHIGDFDLKGKREFINSFEKLTGKTLHRSIKEDHLRELRWITNNNGKSLGWDPVDLSGGIKFFKDKLGMDHAINVPNNPEIRELLIKLHTTIRTEQWIQ